jgi:hypothetical protein
MFSLTGYEQSHFRPDGSGVANSDQCLCRNVVTLLFLRALPVLYKAMSILSPQTLEFDRH